MCYCFTVLVVHLSYISHVEFCLLSHVVCFHTLDLCGLLFSHVFASIYFRLSFLLYYLDNCVRYLVLQSFFFFFLHRGATFLTAAPHTGLGPQQRLAAPFSGSGVLSRALLQTSGWKDFISTSGVGSLQGFLCLQGYKCWQCETWAPTYFWHPYSLKPPGASLVTLPCHPSPGGSLGMVYHHALKCFTLAYIPVILWGQLPSALSHRQALGLLASRSHVGWVADFWGGLSTGWGLIRCPGTRPFGTHVCSGRKGSWAPPSPSCAASRYTRGSSQWPFLRQLGCSRVGQPGACSPPASSPGASAQIAGTRTGMAIHQSPGSGCRWGTAMAGGPGGRSSEGTGHRLCSWPRHVAASSQSHTGRLVPGPRHRTICGQEVGIQRSSSTGAP